MQALPLPDVYRMKILERFVRGRKELAKEEAQERMRVRERRIARKYRRKSLRKKEREKPEIECIIS